MHALIVPSWPSWRLGDQAKVFVWRKAGPARRVTLLSQKSATTRHVSLLDEPTFCFSCKQFATLWMEMIVWKVESPWVARVNKQWWIQGRCLGAPPPLIFKPNWGPEGGKKCFETPPPPSYLDVWIRHWRVTLLHRTTFLHRYTRKLSTYLDSINRPVMLWKWTHNLFWWRLSFPVTGEHRPLLCSNHKFGRHGRFKFQWHASLWTGIFFGIWTQWKGFSWFTHFAYVPPKNLPVCAGWETLSTLEEILGLN